jgi:hypothetical protein
VIAASQWCLGTIFDLLDSCISPAIAGTYSIHTLFVESAMSTRSTEQFFRGSMNQASCLIVVPPKMGADPNGRDVYLPY